MNFIACVIPVRMGRLHWQLLAVYAMGQTRWYCPKFAPKDPAVYATRGIARAAQEAAYCYMLQNIPIPQGNP